MTGNEVVVRENAGFLSPAADMATVQERYVAMNQFVKSVMRRDVDYGKIPGAGDKPTLLKPGAEKLSTFFGLSATFQLVEKVEDWTGAEHDGEPFFYYWYKAVLSHGDQFVGDGDGSCNSWEKKHRYRSRELHCPECGAPALMRSKYPPRDNPNEQPGWYCYGKKGGCGANFRYNHPDIINQSTGMVINPNPADLVNTLQKMAQKRALVAAVLVTTNASEYFTQDIEDMDFGPNVMEGTFIEEQSITPPSGKNQQEPIDPKDAKILALIDSLASLDDDTVIVTQNQRMLLRHVIDDVVFQDNNAHHMLFKLIFNEPHLNNLTGGAVVGMLDWLKLKQDSDGDYTTGNKNMLHALMKYAQKMDGQQPLFDETE